MGIRENDINIPIIRARERETEGADRRRAARKGPEVSSEETYPQLSRKPVNSVRFPGIDPTSRLGPFQVIKEDDLILICRLHSRGLTPFVTLLKSVRPIFLYSGHCT